MNFNYANQLFIYEQFHIIYYMDCIIDLPSVTLVCIDDIDPLNALIVMKHCCKQINFGAIKLFTSKPDIDYLCSYAKVELITVAPINSLDDYGSFIIKKLYDFIETSHVLIIQRDGFIANPSAWSDEFLQYDYIGARWPIYPHNPKRNSLDRCVGNGGFSLRSKKLLNLCVNVNISHKTIPTPVPAPEDLLICIEHRDYFEQNGCKFAPIEQADLFSAEYTPYRDQFGFHSPMIRKMLFPRYPDLNIIRNNCV